MKTWQKAVIKILSPHLEKQEPVHGTAHAARVFKYCCLLAKDYRDVDIDALFLASYLHDFGYFTKVENHMKHAKFSVKFLNLLINKIKISPKKIALVRQIILNHPGKTVSGSNLPIEIYIFHDADKIEGLGAIGAMRLAGYAGQVGRKIWDPTKKRNSNLPYGGNFSAIHTILDYQMKVTFYTKAGKKIAQERRRFSKLLVNEFLREYNFKS